jgi:membrane dipeptidase
VLFSLRSANALMELYPLIDGHNDLAWQFRLNGSATVWAPGSYNLSANLIEFGLQTDIPRLRLGRLSGQWWSVYTRCYMADAVRATFEQIDIVKSFVARYSDTFQMAYTAADINTAFQNQKIASLIGIEGGHSIDSSFGALRAFYAAGVRYMVRRERWTSDRHGPEQECRRSDRRLRSRRIHRHRLSFPSSSARRVVLRSCVRHRC